MKSPFKKLFIMTFLLLGIGLFVNPQNCSAASQVVTNTNADGAGSLHQAITDVGDGEEITFQGGLTGTITIDTNGLSSGYPLTGKTITITGPGASDLTVTFSGDGDGMRRFFNIGAGGDLTISGLVIAGFSAFDENGGAFYNEGTLAIDDCIVAQNSVNSSGNGGAIYNEGTLNVTSSMIVGNESVGDGGGIYSTGTLTIDGSSIGYNTADDGGGIFVNGGTVNVNNTTFTNNEATDEEDWSRAGGISSYAPNTEINLDHVTIAENTPSGIRSCNYSYQEEDCFSHDLNIKNSIIYGGGDNESINSNDNWLLTGYTIIDVTPDNMEGAGDEYQIGTNATLSAVENEILEITTHYTFGSSTSIAIDFEVEQGDPAYDISEEDDQLGEGNRDAIPDIGAFEYVPCTIGDRYVYDEDTVETLPGTYTNEYFSIAEAVSEACDVSGATNRTFTNIDTVFIHEGTYLEQSQIAVNKALNIYAFDGDYFDDNETDDFDTDVVIVEGNTTSPNDMEEEISLISDQEGIFSLNHDGNFLTNLKDLTIRNGYNNTINVWEDTLGKGGCISSGVFHSDDDDVTTNVTTLENITVQGCKANDFGGGDLSW